VQQAGAFAQQLGACLGQHGLARAAVVEQNVQRILDLANSVSQGAGHHAHGARGGGKTARSCNGLQHGQGLGGQDIACILHGVAFKIEMI
jgi:hypothetical protein